MKKIMRGILLSLILVLMAGIGYGAITCTFDQAATTVGTSSSYIRGAKQLFNITIVGADANVNATAGVLSAGATGCTITTTIFNDTSSNWTKMNWTVDTQAMKDDTACTFTAIVINVSNQNTIATCTTKVYISDNSKPAYSDYSPAEGTVDSDGTVDFSVTCSNTSSATLWIEDLFYPMAESADVCTVTVTDLRNSLQSWYVVGSDGLNTTTSSTTKVEIRRSGGASVQGGQLVIGAGQPAAQPQKGIKGFIDFLISIPGMFLRPIFNFINSIFK